MSKGRKTGSRTSSRSSSHGCSTDIRPKELFDEQPTAAENDIEPNNNIDAIETRSVAESDGGQLHVATNAKEVTAPEAKYDEPSSSLANIIIVSYDGARDDKGQFSGQGKAVFVGGNTYEGNFSDGVMHGHGKYIWLDGMQYDGDINNNQITGYGRYEWPDQSYYEGEVHNGLRHGVGVFKTPRHNISYSGQWYLGKRHGRGIMHYSEHSWYEGDWVNSTRHGWGVRRYHTGNVYEGQWVNGKRHGEGTMRWLTSDESYTGMWENGVQHGCGTHTWYLHRVPGSQYPLRNEYVGDFINGLRHGRGKFFFASGAVYSGEWENNKKHGWGKFVFKNGRVFEGQFENDHMVDHPNFSADGSQSPDSSNIRTHTPTGVDEELSRSGGINASLLGPSLSLDIDFILDDFKPEVQSEELQQVTFLMLRNVSILRRIYSFYSALGHDRSPDNTFVMTRFQFWRFLKDCRIHHHAYTLSAMDRIVARCHAAEDVHNPMEKLLLREFLSSCVALGYAVYKDVESGNEGKNCKTTMLSRCFQRMLDEHILHHSCRVGGHFLFEPRRAVTALAYMDRCWQIYQEACSQQSQPPYEASLRMRQFLFLLKDLKVVGPQLSTSTILQVLSSDDPNVFKEECFNVELEMTFMEFFEALIGCAAIFNTAGGGSSQDATPKNQLHHAVVRPGSSVSQCAGVAVQENSRISGLNMFTDNASHQGSELGGSSIGSRHSALHRVRAGTGEFLQTLSQLSMHDDAGNIVEEAASVVGETVEEKSKETDEKTSKEQEQFDYWSKQLHIFFTHHFFPQWHEYRLLCTEVEKHKTAEQERWRIESVNKEAEQRNKSLLGVQSVESLAGPIASDTTCTDDGQTIGASTGNEDDDSQIAALERSNECSSPVALSSQSNRGRSGKGKKGK